jgi:hypothetical protein
MLGRTLQVSCDILPILMDVCVCVCVCVVSVCTCSCMCAYVNVEMCLLVWTQVCT